MAPTLTIGTRGSQLALWQANWVKSALEQHNPEIHVELKIIKTQGDKILDVPLAKVGGKGLFVKEIEEALLDGRVDLAVHSMKDMPADIPAGLTIGAVPERENPLDVLISKNNDTLSALPQGACIGTSSLRRASQLRHARPDIDIRTLRGNLDTRLRKLDTDNLDAIVLAAAGVKRLGYEDRIAEYLAENLVLPAVGQGALCIEIRKNDERVQPVVEMLNHKETFDIVTAERAFLRKLEGGCQVPIAAHGHIRGTMLELGGMVADIDGSVLLRETVQGPRAASQEIGTDLAEKLLGMGAQPILDKLLAEGVS